MSHQCEVYVRGPARRAEDVLIGTVNGDGLTGSVRTRAIRKFKIKEWGSCRSKPVGDDRHVAEIRFSMSDATDYQRVLEVAGLAPPTALSLEAKMPSYAEARADFEYLETLAELSDQVDLDSQREDLMRNPTKAQAAKMYVSGIRLWLREHGHRWSNGRTKQIKERYA